MPTNPSSPERASAAAVSSVENLRAGATAQRRGRPALDSQARQPDALTEPSTASPGAVDLTLLHSEAVGRMRALAGSTLGACAMIAILFAWMVWG